MDPETLLAAIPAHIDALQSVVYWATLLVLPVGLAALLRQPTVAGAGIAVPRKHAFLIFATLFLIANFTVWLLLLRLAGLVTLLDTARVSAAVTSIATHPWALNPLGYFGSNTTALVHASISHAMLVTLWFVCCSSLVALRAPRRNWAPLLLLCFVALALSAHALSEVRLALVRKAADTGQQPLLVIVANMLPTGVRWWGSAVGIAVGTLLLGSTYRITRRKASDYVVRAL